MSGKRTSPKRRTPSAQAGAEAKAIADGANAITIAERMDELSREAVVIRAIERVRASAKNRSRSTVWKNASLWILRELATLVYCEHLSVEKARDQIVATGRTPAVEKFAEIPLRNLQGWMKSIDKAYDALADEMARDRADVAELDAAKGDPVRMAQMFGTRLMYVLYPMLGGGFSGMSVGEQHVFLRTFEALTQSNKLAAETRHKDAQANKILADLARIVKAAESEGGGGARKTAEEKLAEVRRAVHTALGMPPDDGDEGGSA